LQAAEKNPWQDERLFYTRLAVASGRHSEHCSMLVMAGGGEKKNVCADPPNNKIENREKW
jgi:hypothetical protein